MSLGALKTSFTQPPSCTASFSSIYVSYYGDIFEHIAGPASTDGGCLPDHYKAARTNYYSPGICPVGYTNACSSTNTAGSATETVVTCCPTNFNCNTQSNVWQSTMGCSSAFDSLSTKMTVFSSGTTRTTTSTWTSGAVNAYSVQVRFQDTDFRGATPPSATTSTVSSRNTVSPTTTHQNDAGASDSLGKGAIAGVVVGAIAGLGLIIGIAYFLTRRFLQRKPTKDAGGQITDATLENKVIHELPSHHTVSELGTSTIARQI